MLNNVTGIVIREHFPSKYINKFPKWLYISVIVLGVMGIPVFYGLALNGTIHPFRDGSAILYFALNIAVLLGGITMLPHYTQEQYLVEVTPELSAIDWMDIQEKYEITKEQPQVYRLLAKSMKEENYV